MRCHVGRPIEHADPQPPWVGTNFIDEGTGERRGDVRVAGFVSGDRIEHGSRVAHAAGDTTIDGCTGPRLTDQRRLADPTPAGLEADQPAFGRRNADRAAAVVGVADSDDARGYRGGRTARRSPVEKSRFHGLRDGPYASGSVVMVLPISTRSARSRPSQRCPQLRGAAAFTRGDDLLDGHPASGVEGLKGSRSPKAAQPRQPRTSAATGSGGATEKGKRETAPSGRARRPSETRPPRCPAETTWGYPGSASRRSSEVDANAGPHRARGPS